MSDERERDSLSNISHSIGILTVYQKPNCFVWFYLFIYLFIFNVRDKFLKKMRKSRKNYKLWVQALHANMKILGTFFTLRCHDRKSLEPSPNMKSTGCTFFSQENVKKIVGLCKRHYFHSFISRYTHTHTYTHIYIYIYRLTYIFAYIHTYIHIYIYIYICMYICIYIHILCMCIMITEASENIYTLTHIFAYIDLLV